MRDEYEYDDYGEQEELEGEELSDDEYDEFDHAGGMLPWWIKKAPAVLISVALHMVIMMICAYYTLVTITTEQAYGKALIKQEFKEPDYDETLKRAMFKTPKIICDKIVERPLIILEEEVKLTKDMPRGTSLDNLSNKNLNSRSVNDAYGIGGGAAGAYGLPWGDGSLENEGGNEGTESAVEAALRWLRFHQDKNDGKWDGDDFQKNCKGGTCDGKGAPMYDVGLTGLSLLAFLSHGETHRAGKHKRVVSRGQKFLRKQQKSDGQLGERVGESWMYNHAIATMALANAYGITLDPTLKAAAQKAVDFAVNAQNPGLGWRYSPRKGNNDTSVTGWLVLALKHAKVSGLNVPGSTFEGARNWLDRVTASNGRCGYIRPGDRGSHLPKSIQPKDYNPVETMTGVGIICRIFTGQSKKEWQMKKGVELIMNKLPDYNRPDFLNVNYYYWYNATYAMFQIGGPKWKKWNVAMQKALVPTQRVGGCQDGSWDTVGEWCVVGGRVYATAINALTLEIYYRYARLQR